MTTTISNPTDPRTGTIRDGSSGDGAAETAADDLIRAAEGLAPMLRRRAPEIESARRLPPDVLKELIDTGCFRVLKPPSHGGFGASLGTALSMFEVLARADASTAWTVMIGAGIWIDLASLPRESFDELFAADADVLVAGAINPTGSIVPDGDGYRVDGRWAFASGCEHADWLVGNCLEGVVDGQPQFRAAVFPAADVVIEDTWYVAGMRGTGSHHFHVEGVVVPAAHTLIPLHEPPCIDEPIVHMPVPAIYAMCAAGVALGIARGAIDDILAVAPSKVPVMSTGPLGGNPGFHDVVARADTEVRAARALLHSAADTAWAAAEARRPATLADRAALRAASTWVVERAEAAVDAAHRAGGGGAVYADNPLQRRLRDIQTLRQHFLVRPDTFITAGAILAGRQPDVPVF